MRGSQTVAEQREDVGDLGLQGGLFGADGTRVAAWLGPVRAGRRERGRPRRVTRRRLWAPTATLSRTLRLAKTRPCWKVRARPWPARRSGGPAGDIGAGEVDAAGIGAVMAADEVEQASSCPAPLGPMIDSISPSCSEKPMPSTAVMPPKRRVRPSVWSRTAVMPCPADPAGGSGSPAAGPGRR